MTSMRPAHSALLVAALATLVIGLAIAFTPRFPGDIAVARAIQSVSPHPEWWARPISNLAPAPGKYYVIAIVETRSLFVGGWRGLALFAGFLMLEQYGAEHTKALFKRPRPSHDVIAVVGSPSGYTFPSTTLTFFSVTFGSLGIIAALSKQAPNRTAVMVVTFAMVLAGCVARVALGAHWPSDVLMTVGICLLWIWAAAKSVLRPA